MVPKAWFSVSGLLGPSEEVCWDKSSKLFGYIRVLDSEKIQILASSGHDFFFDPSRDAGVPPSTIEWIERLDREEHIDYLARCQKMDPAYGVAFGHRQLGVRKPCDANTAVCRVWLLHCARRYWTHAQVLEAVQGTLSGAAHVKQRQVSGGVDLYIRGATTGDQDMAALPVEDQSGRLMLWLRWAPPRQVNAQGRKVSVEATVHLGPLCHGACSC